MRFLFCLFAMTAICACAQDSTNVAAHDGFPRSISRQGHALTFSTPAYNKEALRLIINEANSVAQELNLQEAIPITESNLVEKHIVPPRMAKIGIGSITTSNYIYYISIGDKFSSVIRTDSNRIRSSLAEKYLWPMNQIDTNAAYLLAAHWLKAASVDVEALNSNCDLSVHAFIPEGINGKHFVPLYRVYWTAKGGDPRSIAGVELLEPTKSLQQLYVKKSEYILRKPLVITNLDFLLTQTNTLIQTNQ